ncbi:MAG: GNA1162 family protein, partial [Pseudobdellovibrio sp.]
SLILVGCVTSKNYDKFRAANVRSILVLPPKNQSTDIRGTYSFLSTVTMPIAEKGFYVFPVSIVDQMMKENGVPSADEMHTVSLKKIKEILNPDAVLYITLEQYGSKFVVVQSQTTVVASARLIATATGELLWEGKAAKVIASSDGGGGLTGMLVSAMVSQAVNSSVDHAHNVSVIASQELFMTQGQGLLNGPYKPESKE